MRVLYAPYITSSASPRDSRASATSCTSEMPRPISTEPDAVWPPLTAAAYFPLRLGSTGIS